MRAALLPRGVIHSWVTDTDTDEVDPRYGPVGKQRVEDTGRILVVDANRMGVFLAV